MSFSHYNKDTGLITHFDGDGKNVVATTICLFILILFSMIVAFVDEIFGPFDLPFILQFVKFVGDMALGFLLVIIKLVWDWWLDIAG